MSFFFNPNQRWSLYTGLTVSKKNRKKINLYTKDNPLSMFVDFIGCLQ